MHMQVLFACSEPLTCSSRICLLHEAIVTTSHGPAFLFLPVGRLEHRPQFYRGPEPQYGPLAGAIHNHAFVYPRPQVLETAMSLPGVRSPASSEQAARLAKRGCLASVHERARIYLLLAEVTTSIGKPQAATEVRKVCGVHGA